jgi:hypothetical protein
VFPTLLLLSKQARGENFAAIVGSMAFAFENHATTLLLVNKVVAATRFDGLTFTFYNSHTPATDLRITAASNANIQPQESLVSGEVQIAGGVGNRGVMGSVDLYNPATSAWMETGNLKVGIPANTLTPQFNTRSLVWCRVIVAF